MKPTQSACLSVSTSLSGSVHMGIVSEPGALCMRRKGLGTLLNLSCPQDRMLTWPIRIVDCKINDVLEMFFFSLQALSVAND